MHESGISHPGRGIVPSVSVKWRIQTDAIANDQTLWSESECHAPAILSGFGLNAMIRTMDAEFS